MGDDDAEPGMGDVPGAGAGGSPATGIPGAQADAVGQLARILAEAGCPAPGDPAAAPSAEPPVNPAAGLPRSLGVIAAEGANKRAALDLLASAGLPPPETLDPLALWRDMLAVFQSGDAMERLASGPTSDDVVLLDKLAKAANAFARAAAALHARDDARRHEAHDKPRMPHVYEEGRRRSAPDWVPQPNVTLLLRLATQATDAPALAQLALDHLLICPPAADELARLAASLRAVLTEEQLAGPVLVPGPGKSGRAWLLAKGLPSVFEKHLGQKPTFTPKSDDLGLECSDCISFIQAAFTATGRKPPRDTAVVAAVARYKPRKPNKPKL